MDLAKTDVYSFSILTWQLFVGSKPYAELVHVVRPSDFFAAVVGGQRPSLAVLNACEQRDISRIVVECWNHDPEWRPHFQEIYQRLQASRRDTN